jgi:hypothetical protein
VVSGLPRCRPADVEVSVVEVGTSEDDRRAVRIGWPAATGGCEIGAVDVTLSFTGPADGRVSPLPRLRRHDPSSNPPRARRLQVRPDTGVVVPFRWSGSNCVVADSVVVVAGDEGFRAPFLSGLPCDSGKGRALGELEVALAHQEGGADGRLGDRRGSLVALVEDVVVDGDEVTWVARLANPLPVAVPLTPCPAYAVLVEEVQGVTGRPESVSPSGLPGEVSGSTGSLPCEAAPREVPPDGSVAFAMRAPLRTEALGEVLVTWAVAGPPPATGTSSVRPGPTARALPGGACRAGDLAGRLEAPRAVDGGRVERPVVLRKRSPGTCVLDGLPSGAVFAQRDGTASGNPLVVPTDSTATRFVLHVGDEVVARLQHGTCESSARDSHLELGLPSGDSLTVVASDPRWPEGVPLAICEPTITAFATR